MFRFLPYLKKYRIYVILGPIFKLIEAVFELIVPIVTSLIIDKGVRQGDLTYVWHMGGVLIGLGAVGLGSALICQKFASIASLGFGTAVRNQMYEKINTFSHAEIDRFGTPSLITRITNDVNQLQQAVALLIRLVIRAPFLAIGAVIAAMFLLGYYADGRPVMGLPGCVMYAKATIFDLVLPRIAAGVRLTRRDFVALGEGGLCLGCEVCTYPHCGFGGV